MIFHVQLPKKLHKIIKDINKKGTAPDKIPPNIIKLSGNIFYLHFTNIINKNIDNNHFSAKAKIASVRRIFKKKEGKNLKTTDQSVF